MKKQYAFIDEFGNHGFDFTKPDVSSHYIITSVIVDEDSISEAEIKLDAIRKMHFQTGEMKSNSIGDNDNRRIKILQDLSSVHFHIYALVVDKRKLEGEGIKYKQSFLKFLHSQLESQIILVYPNVKLFLDNHGGDEFKESFKKYVQTRYVPTLFNETEVSFLDSKNSLFIQVADIITGTLAKCFDVNKISKNPDLLLKPINEKIIEIKEFPKNYEIYKHLPDVKELKFNDTISQLSITLATNYIDKKINSKNPLEKDIVICLKYLLFYFKFINPNIYVPTRELLRQIEMYKTLPVTIHYFRSKVIAKLRDEGILIASSSKGYKLPAHELDLIDFMNHNNSIIQPMLSRIEKCINTVSLATKNELDLLEIPAYSNLKKFFD